MLDRRLKKIEWVFGFLLFLIFSGCQFQSPYPKGQGTLFIRQQICDLSEFKNRFFSLKNNLKGNGFLSYSFQRDLRDPKTYILEFQCSNLKKAVDFIQSSNFLVACVGGAGLGLPVLWAGVGNQQFPIPNQSQGTGGLVVGRYELKGNTFWKKIWDGGKFSDLFGDKREEMLIRLYPFAGNPRQVLVVQEVADILKAQEIMNSREMKNNFQEAGLIPLNFWFGTNLEDGNF
jgi:hypothetical protein